MSDFLFSSESVTEGHPDKIADQISDAVLDACLTEDPASRVACETLITTGLVVLAGEITTKAKPDFQKIVRSTISDIGYTDSDFGFDANTCAVMVSLDRQSPDISQGVSQGEGLYKDLGAGDQGLMFGFACNETPELMPLPIALSHRLTQGLAKLRKSGELGYLRPDGKAQVTIGYQNNQPKSIHTIVVSTQHDEKIDHQELEAELKQKLIEPLLPKDLDSSQARYLVNPTGRFVIGGPMGDCGLTGRKIIVDTYGGMGRHGGGAFSGKDATKVDRSACYMARYAAKNIVAAGLCDRCEVQVAYAIGYPEPVSVMLNTFGTEHTDPNKIQKAVHDLFSFKPADIIAKLELTKPIFRQTAAYGHFGRVDCDLPWEKTDLVSNLKTLL